MISGKMAWSCCCCSSIPATTFAVAVPAINAAARARNGLSITPRKQNVSTQLMWRGNRKIGVVLTDFRARSKSTESELRTEPSTSDEIDCIGTGLDVECVVTPADKLSENPEQAGDGIVATTSDLFELAGAALEWGLLISPFFFWGTAMVAMKEVLPKTGPFFLSAFRLIPAGFLLVGFAASRGRAFPSGLNACVTGSSLLDHLTDGEQGFLAEGLERTSAGLGSVIIDSQPLTVAILASLFFGESIGYIGAAGLVLGVLGLLLLEVPALTFDPNNFSLWGSGEWWMLLAAQSMAIGTVMVRWVSKYSDPVMATGWLYVAEETYVTADHRMSNQKLVLIVSMGFMGKKLHSHSGSC
ncbi:WAT1-related protein, chloroplastic [Sesamum angolense]|uniref:WAT1-related protein, chloroplastic n=1 Tax=Sesamum angolense TaxID=2727404 RepID=A0AAE1XCK2_9LAMI|nr:WAT1-related protein, chloroplastic [Sesamum angolense]